MDKQLTTEMSSNELIERFAEVNKLTIEQATELIGGETSEEILNNITRYTISNIRSKNSMKMNRKQRRALLKKMGKEKYSTMNDISDAVTKINYIDLIERFRKLNEQKEKEEDDTNVIEDN